MNTEQLLLYGERLPIQLVNSEVLPIIKEVDGKISCLLFCAHLYSKDYLSRLIWLSHKLCGLTNEIRIYFYDYDDNKKYEVDGVKQRFKDESVTSKISVHKLNQFDFVSLKEEQFSNDNDNYCLKTPQKDIVYSNVISDDIEKILPFGDMLIPKLRTGVLSEINLWCFLLKKGIITQKRDKEELFKVFTYLLLSPRELDYLKNQYKEKENKIKEIKRETKLKQQDISLWEYLNMKANELCSLQKFLLPKNCTLKENYCLQRMKPDDPNHLILKYTIIKENTNKDFLTGKTEHEGEIEIKKENGALFFYDRHTSNDTYKVNKLFYDKFNKTLKKDNIIQYDFKSISFLDFDNNGRIQFLLSFMKMEESKETFSEIKVTLEDMKFRADETIKDIPKELMSHKGRVSNLNLHGKDLNNTIYLNDEEYRKAELCERLKYSIFYKYMNQSGICYLDISFTNALGKSDFTDAELRIGISPSSNTYDANYSKTAIAIKKIVDDLKDNSYKQFKQ